MSEKIYCGSGKEFGQYGTVNLSICLDELPDEHVFTGKNGKRYVKLKLNKKRQVDQYGKTHYIEVDTWKPDNSGGQSNYQVEEEIPF